MKSIKLLGICVCVFFLAQCHKDECAITADAHFFSTDVQKERALYLFIDGKPHGKLPKQPGAPDCANPKIDSLTLSFTLKSGKYDLQVKDSSGTVYSSSSLKFSENKTEVRGTMGSSWVSMSNDHCLRVGLGSAE